MRRWWGAGWRPWGARARLLQVNRLVRIACRVALSWCAGDGAAEEIELSIWNVAQVLLEWGGECARVDIGGGLCRERDDSVVVARVPAGVHSR